MLQTLVLYTYVSSPGDNRMIDSFNDGGCCLNDVDAANLVVDAESKVKLAIVLLEEHLQPTGGSEKQFSLIKC